MAKTTKKDFKLFKAECGRWIEFFGLKQWRVAYFHGGDPEVNTDCQRRFLFNTRDKTCVIWLVEKWDDAELNEYSLRREAFYSVVVGILFANMQQMLYDCDYSSLTVEAQTYWLARTLENTVFKDG